MPHFVVPTSLIVVLVVIAALIVGYVVKEAADRFCGRLLAWLLDTFGSKRSRSARSLDHHDPEYVFPDHAIRPHDIFEFGEYQPKCPHCKMAFPSNEPRPSCNECETCFCSENCRTEHHLFEKLEHNYDAPLPDMEVPDEYRARFPHCDDKVLHAPGECRFCDMYPDRQAERVKNLVSFTGHLEIGKTPCPSTELRSLDQVHAWGGNRPAPPIRDFNI